MSDILEIGPDALNAVADLHQTVFDDGWSAQAFREFFEKQHALGWMIYDDDTLIAFAITLPCVDNSELITIATHPDFRGQGLAGKLLKNAIEANRRLSFQKLLLEVAEDNSAAIALYEKSGFLTDGRRKRYYQRKDGPAKDAILMSCDLRSL